MIDDVKRFPEDFDEIGRELEDGDVLLGADGRTGKGVTINASRVSGSGASAFFSSATGTEYKILNINGTEIKAEV